MNILRAVLPLLFLPGLLTAASTLQPVALSGERAPGTPEGVTFLTFVSLYAPDLPVPKIDEQGRVLFFAFLRGPGVSATNGHGLWIFDGSSNALLVRAGDPAPGTEPGTTFVGLPSDVVPVGFDISDGIAVVPATLRGHDFFHDDGIWQGDATGLQLVIREGTPAPGTGGTFFSPALVERTRAGVLFGSALRGSGIDDDNDESIWSIRGSATILHAREGAPAPGTSVFFGHGHIGAGPSTFPLADSNDAGQVIIRGNLLGSRVDSYNDEALFIDRGDGLRLYLREGDPAPGAPRRMTFGGSSVQLLLNYPVLNSQGQVAFSVRLGGRRGKIATTDAIYSDHRGNLLPIAIAGDPAPGTGKNWLFMLAPFLSDGSRVAFLAALDPDFRPRYGVFWDQPGTVTPLILPGAPIPERAGATLYSANPIVAYTATGFLVFRADVMLSSGVTVPALLSAEPNGALHTLVAVGDVWNSRQVTDVHAGELSANGTLALRLNFSDGSNGVFTLQLLGLP